MLIPRHRRAGKGRLSDTVAVFTVGAERCSLPTSRPAVGYRGIDDWRGFVDPGPLGGLRPRGVVKEED